MEFSRFKDTDAKRRMFRWECICGSQARGSQTHVHSLGCRCPSTEQVGSLAGVASSMHPSVSLYVRCEPT
jgi:hypothetical protein